jgi:glycerophosphoryl diester phosphodiesterase
MQASPAHAGSLARFCLANGYLLNIEIKPTPGTEAATGRGRGASGRACGRALPCRRS